MNTGTKVRTILAIATSLNTALMATDITGFHNGTLDTIYKVVSIILNFVIVALATYYNNDYTEEANYHTEVMRLEKANEDLPDDYFEDDEDEGEDLTYEEEATEDIDDGPNDGGEEDGELDS